MSYECSIGSLKKKNVLKWQQIYTSYSKKNKRKFRQKMESVTNYIICCTRFNAYQKGFYSTSTNHF